MPLRTALPALAIALALTGPAIAQTKPAAAAKSTAHPAASSTALPPNIPRVAGIPKVAYSLKYIEVKRGTGALVTPGQYLSVHYTGWLTDGKKFDSSVDRGQPITFKQGQHRVIIGWDTAFEGMHVGGKRRLFIPYQLAYGDQGRPPVIPAKAPLIFDIELVAASDTPPAPPTPPTPPTPPPAQPSAPATPPPAATPPPSSTPPPTSAPAAPATPATPPPASTPKPN